MEEKPGKEDELEEFIKAGRTGRRNAVAEIDPTTGEPVPQEVLEKLEGLSVAEGGEPEQGAEGQAASS